jgi:hypothetical protein
VAKSFSNESYVFRRWKGTPHFFYHGSFASPMLITIFLIFPVIACSSNGFWSKQPVLQATQESSIISKPGPIQKDLKFPNKTLQSFSERLEWHDLDISNDKEVR